MSNNTNHNKLILISITPSHTNNNIKLAKSIFPTPTLIIQKIIPSIPSSHHKISALSQNALQKNMSNITHIIKNPSVTKKLKQQYISKIKTHVEKLKSKKLIPSRPRTAYSTYPTTKEHNWKTLTCNPSIQQPIILVTNDTPELFIPISTTQKIQHTNPRQNSTVFVDNTFLTPNRTHHPQRIKNYTRDC